LIADMFTSSFLSEMRRKALRKGVWYKALDALERGILSLTSRVIERVESAVLGVELVKILSKLRDSMMSGFVRRVREFGLWRAREVAEQAVGWGHETSAAWASNLSFARYLTLMDYYWPSGFGV